MEGRVQNEITLAGCRTPAKKTKRCTMKNRLRNIVSPLTPRNYPNMRELLLLFIFPLLLISFSCVFWARRNIVATLNLSHAHRRKGKDKDGKRGKIY